MRGFMSDWRSKMLVTYKVPYLYVKMYKVYKNIKVAITSPQ